MDCGEDNHVEVEVDEGDDDDDLRAVRNVMAWLTTLTLLTDQQIFLPPRLLLLQLLGPDTEIIYIIAMFAVFSSLQ